MDEIFETERNRFCYPIEPEAVYIRGDFDVTARGKAGRAIRYISVEADGFRIGRPTPKAYGELTAQNLWFYRGNARYDFSVRKREGERLRCVSRRITGRWSYGRRTARRAACLRGPWKRS